MGVYIVCTVKILDSNAFLLFINTLITVILLYGMISR
jgi:hypothetical protein